MYTESCEPRSGDSAERAETPLNRNFPFHAFDSHIWSCIIHLFMMHVSKEKVYTHTHTHTHKSLKHSFWRALKQEPALEQQYYICHTDRQHSALYTYKTVSLGHFHLSDESGHVMSDRLHLKPISAWVGIYVCFHQPTSVNAFQENYLETAFLFATVCRKWNKMVCTNEVTYGSCSVSTPDQVPGKGGCIWASYILTGHNTRLHQQIVCLTFFFFFISVNLHSGKLRIQGGGPKRELLMCQFWHMMFQTIKVKDRRVV